METLFHCDFCGKIATKSNKEYNRNIKNKRGNFCCAQCAGFYGVLRKRHKKAKRMLWDYYIPHALGYETKKDYPFSVGRRITNKKDKVVEVLFYDEDMWLHGILVNKGWEIVIKPAALLDWRLVNKSKNSNLRV